MKRQRVALDFDGVLHKYSKKWHDGTIYDEPIAGTQGALGLLAHKYDLVIFTCRTPIEDVRDWVEQRFQLDIEVTNDKPHADIYIDDRGYHFDGSWSNALAEIDRRLDRQKEDGWVSVGEEG